MRRYFLAGTVVAASLPLLHHSVRAAKLSKYPEMSAGRHHILSRSASRSAITNHLPVTASSGSVPHVPPAPIIWCATSLRTPWQYHAARVSPHSL